MKKVCVHLSQPMLIKRIKTQELKWHHDTRTYARFAHFVRIFQYFFPNTHLHLWQSYVTYFKKKMVYCGIRPRISISLGQNNVIDFEKGTK